MNRAREQAARRKITLQEHVRGTKQGARRATLTYARGSQV